MVSRLNFSGLSRGDWDEIYMDSCPGIIGGSYGEDLSHNPQKVAGKSQSQILWDNHLFRTIRDMFEFKYGTILAD
jgi:hypothetical protein